MHHHLSSTVFTKMGEKNNRDESKEKTYHQSFHSLNSQHFNSLGGCGMFSKDYPVALPSGALVDKRNTLPYRQDQAAKAETGTDILKH